MKLTSERKSSVPRLATRTLKPLSRDRSHSTGHSGVSTMSEDCILWPQVFPVVQNHLNRLFYSGTAGGTGNAGLRKSSLRDAYLDGPTYVCGK